MTSFLWVLFTLLYIQCSGELILQLTESNFSSTIGKEPLLLINFYTPWCGHCQQLDPILLKVAKDLFDSNATAKIAQIDASIDGMETILEKENIDGFPTLMLYKEGLKFGEYTGQRTESELAEYLKLKSSPLVQYLNSQMELIPYLTFLENSDIFETGFLSLAVAFFPSDGNRKVEDNPNFQLFKNVALHYDLSSFFYTDNEELMKSYHIKEDSILVFTGDKNDIFHKISFYPNSTKESITQNLLVAALPLSVPFTTDTQSLLNTIPIYSHALVFYDVAGSDDIFLDNLIMIAPKFKGQIMLVEVSSEEYSLLHYFNLRPSDLPQLFIIDLTDDLNPKRFSFVEFLHETYMKNPSLIHSLQQDNHLPEKKLKRVTTEENTEEEFLVYNKDLIELFFDSFVGGRLSRSLLSEDISVAVKLNDEFFQFHKRYLPYENIVGTQFIHKVFEESKEKDVLVYFHAPWCLHCKAAESLMLELALQAVDQQQNQANNAEPNSIPPLQIYRIDGSKNEISLEFQFLQSHSQNVNSSSATSTISHSIPLRIDGFPTFYYFSKFNKFQPVEYMKDRSIELLQDFLQQKREYFRNHPFQPPTPQEASVPSIEVEKDHPQRDGAQEVSTDDVAQQEITEEPEQEQHDHQEQQSEQNELQDDQESFNTALSSQSQEHRYHSRDQQDEPQDEEQPEPEQPDDSDDSAARTQEEEGEGSHDSPPREEF